MHEAGLTINNTNMTEEEKAENAVNDAKIRNSQSKQDFIIESLKSKFINDNKFREKIKQEEGFRNYLKRFRDHLSYYFTVYSNKHVAKDFKHYLLGLKNLDNAIENTIINNEKYKDIKFEEVEKITNKYNEHETNLDKIKGNATNLNNYTNTYLWDVEYEEYMTEQPYEKFIPRLKKLSEASEQPAETGGRRKTRRNKKKVDRKTRKATKKGKKSSKRKTLRKKTRK